MANPSNTIVDRYRRWFDYEKDSHARVLVSLETVPEAARATPAYGPIPTPLGKVPTLTVVPPVLVSVSITLTVLLNVLAT